MEQKDATTASPVVIGEHERRLREKLQRELGPTVCGLLADPTVVEIMLNANGLLWAERQGKFMEVVGRMGSSQALSAMATIATYLNTTINRDRPVLECELPLDGSRFAGVVPPITAGPIFAIRKKATRVFTLREYVEQGIMSPAQCSAIEAAVLDRKNILVVGGTGSGKTTLLNAIIHQMVQTHPNHRLGIIEDTGELQCSAPNFVQMRSVDHTSMQDLLKTALRLRIDRVLIGEVRDGHALALLEAWNTGHPGGTGTVHSDVVTPEAALLRMESLVAKATTASQQALIGATVNVIVSITKTDHGRRVQGVTEVLGWDSSTKKYTLKPYGELSHAA